MSKKKHRKRAKAVKKEIVEKTEWQKRHEVFLERQRARQEAERKKEETELAQKKEKLEQLNKEKALADGLIESDDDRAEGAEKKGFLFFGKGKRISSEEKKATRPARVALAKAVSIILTSLFILLCSIFIISPLSKEKYFTVSGLVNANETDVLVATGILKSDYISDVIFNSGKHAKAVEKQVPWVKSAKINYHFPNQFTISVKENRIIAYAQVADDYQPVLENGTRMPVISTSQLPKKFLTVNITDEEAVQTLVKQLAVLDEKIVSEIAVISPISNAATKDLLLLEMKTGHKVRVPLSQIDVKLPYYQKISPYLVEPTIIDMEVGIYATTEAIEALIAEEKPDREAAIAERKEAEKKAAEEQEEERKKAEKEAKEDKEKVDSEEVEESSAEVSESSEESTNVTEIMEATSSEDLSAEDGTETTEMVEEVIEVTSE